MGSSKLDFLDGEDMHSLASSYSSINGSSLKRNAENGKHVNIATLNFKYRTQTLILTLAITSTYS